ncbi:MAG: SAM-dependent methyltransferase [Bacteroidetes bacterium]|nr:SAM-dependent methyltransferase [Bacteroidota bacterium]MBL6942908.1 SAM-dependent methyltransferase [Bacteroidales bacterium]
MKNIKPDGRLYLLPTTLGSFDTIHRVIPDYNTQIIHGLEIFIVEQVRTARRFLSNLKHPANIDKLVFYELNKHTPESEVFSYLDSIKDGISIGLLSEAGTPCVADPGAVVVKMAQERGIQVIPLVGPNSIMLSLMASGFNGQNFVFHGYLPVDKHQLSKKLKEIEQVAYRTDQTQIFIETPYRNNQLFSSILKACSPNTLLCIATDITLPTEIIQTLPLSIWKPKKFDFHKKPTVFLIYRP